MNPITPTLWARMPWHSKAKIIRALEREETRLQGELDVLRDALAEMTNRLSHVRQLSQNAHAAYARGERDEWVVIGERAYQRERKRRVRAEQRRSA